MKPIAAAILAAVLALPAAAAQPTRLSDLAWLTGEWVQTTQKGEVRETWLPARGGAMAAVNQTLREGRTRQMEFIMLTETPDGLVYTAIVAGQPPTPFRLTSLEGGRAVFENQEHDFPKKIIYEPCDADLCAAIEGPMDGQTRRMSWRFKRAR